MSTALSRIDLLPAVVAFGTIANNYGLNLSLFLLVVNCGAPPAIANGQINGSDYTYTATITYSCSATNFKLSGSQERTCQADGTWSGTQPECLGMFCLFNNWFMLLNAPSSFGARGKFGEHEGSIRVPRGKTSSFLS